MNNGGLKSDALALSAVEALRDQWAHRLIRQKTQRIISIHPRSHATPQDDITNIHARPCA